MSLFKEVGWHVWIVSVLTADTAGFALLATGQTLYEPRQWVGWIELTMAAATLIYAITRLVVAVDHFLHKNRTH